ncbi:unnamed protein product [Moneuplotes crassus]|uniref:Large ribosomal subunit protein uL4m n=1 Tax=Euplotes crassus TaxID=5936 RepID=A0AAD1XI21_EUPCR|nr:unnamed protein product [Moneuplotes crassus]
MAFLAYRAYNNLVGKRVMRLTYQRAAYLSEFNESGIKPEPLIKTEEELILKRPWATYPFIKNQEFSIPIYNLHDGEYSGENVELDQELFNVPFRRDLMKDAYLYHTFFGVKTFVRSKTKGTMAGSGRKPKPQKGGGTARQGNIRSPILVKGAKAHGRKPKDYTIGINAKSLLKAMKTTLTGLLYERRIAVIQSESLESYKTKYLNKLLYNFSNPTKRRILFVIPINPCPNFLKASRNIPNINVMNIREMTIKDALKAEAIFFTKQSLSELEMQLETNHMELYRNRNLPRPKLPYDDLLQIDYSKAPDFFDKVKIEMEAFEFDPEKEAHIYSKALQGYLEKAQKYHEQKNELHSDPDIMFVNKAE